MFTRLIWILCFFGFFGMWKLPHKFKPEKTGLHVIEMNIPIGLSKRKILNFMSQVQRYCLDEYEGIDPARCAMLFLSNRLKRDSDVIPFLEYMVRECGTRIQISTDGSGKKEVMGLCNKYNVNVDTFNVTEEVHGVLDRQKTMAAHREAIKVAQQDIVNLNDPCPNCGETDGYDRDGDCRNCNFPALEDMYDLNAMRELAINGKKFKPIKAA